MLADASPERRAVLLEWAAFADFLVERLPALEQEWNAHREALRAAGRLPADPPGSLKTERQGKDDNTWLDHARDRRPRRG